MTIGVMSSDAGSQPLPPPSSQSQTFSFVPSTSPKEPIQRNYVFVDEHNRHKRLKVMRACEGCRRRKIKCDSATTNTWPCAACTRLKLQCVPPSVSYENDSTTPGTHTFELTKSHSYPSVSPTSVPDYQQHTLQPQFGTIDSTLQGSLQPNYGDVNSVQTGIYMETPTASSSLPYGPLPATSIPQDLNTGLMYPLSSVPPPPNSEHGWATESNVSTLADAFGDLQIDLQAKAPYITDQTALAASPAVQEEELLLPSSVGPNGRIHIPPEMMPSDQLALQYFKYFFANIHPIVPVLSPPAFYEQWAHNRDSISPLLLEAIFACVTAMLDKTEEFTKWIALATRHEASFNVVSRLSTVQALILLMKAREGQPSRRGYFYRSWMAIVHIVAMAKDLNLHEHLDDHRDGGSCDSSPSDCLTKTRIWQTIFILEMMVGGPQGRLDFGVESETVEFDEPKLPAVADSEYQVSREYTYFTRSVGNVRQTCMAFKKLRKKGVDWSMREGYTAVEEIYRKWPLETPHDLMIVVPDDESPLWIPSSFIGNMNCYHHLGIIMHHRPQLHYLMEHVQGDSWKDYMLTCLDAAKMLCRITEGLLQTYTIASLRSMQRGVSFTIYAMLTCTMLHLVAITAPDPDINSDARGYFVRSMRLLEQCTPYWPLQSVTIQINALREAFSADVTKPFDLKPGFPFGSPTPQPSEVQIVSPATYSQTHESPLEATGRVSYNLAYPITPPTSTSDEDSKTDSPLPQRMGMMPDHASTAQNVMQAAPSHPQWNPTHLFDKWQTAFYSRLPQPEPENNPPALPSLPSTGEYSLHSTPEYTRSSYSSHSYSPEQNQLPMAPQHGGPTSYPQSYGMAYVSPAAWQDAVASSFRTGGKRRLP